MRECANCGAPLQEAQDWCVKCGTGHPGRFGGRPGWRAGAAILAATVLLVAGASVAAYAALTKHSKSSPHVLALRPATTPSTTPAAPGTPATPGASSTAPSAPGTAAKTPSLPTGAAPPKIPTQTPTPSGGSGGATNGQSAESLLFGEGGGKAGNTSKSSGGKATSKSGSSSGGKGSSGGNGSAKEGVSEGNGLGSSEGGGSKGSGSEGGSGKSEGPEPILLDTNAASTYNPNAYPASLFGDPSLAIDGEGSTAWTASVEAANAPKVQAGLALDLKTAQKLASATIETTTPGMTVEIYGANGHTLPVAIADPAWKRLHGARVLKKKNVTIKLKTKGAAYRFVLLWIVKAPPSSTAAKPGQIAVSELELFPPT